MKITLEIYAHTNLDDMRSALGKLDGKLLRRAVAVTVAVRPEFPDLGLSVLAGYGCGHGWVRTSDPSLVRRVLFR